MPVSPAQSVPPSTRLPASVSKQHPNDRGRCQRPSRWHSPTPAGGGPATKAILVRNARQRRTTILKVGEGIRPDHHPQPHQHAPQPDSDATAGAPSGWSTALPPTPAVSIFEASDPKTLGNAIGAAGQTRANRPYTSSKWLKKKSPPPGLARVRAREMRKMSNECMQGGLLIGGVEGIRPHCSAGSARPPSPAGRCGRGAGGSVSPLNQSERKSRLGAARARARAQEWEQAG